MANWAIIEAALNLGLSVLLARRIGLYGVAWGTSIATTIIHLIFWPRFVQIELHVPVRAYLWDGWGKITLCSIPFGIVCAAADRYWHPTSMVVFFAQILVTLPVYAICAVWIFKDEVRKMWDVWRRSGSVSTQDVSLG
jgi:peptidoglycan biosynthesis protein MviN/MurJ (putative lipid II flippase)